MSTSLSKQSLTTYIIQQFKLIMTHSYEQCTGRTTSNAAWLRFGASRFILTLTVLIPFDSSFSITNVRSIESSLADAVCDLIAARGNSSSKPHKGKLWCCVWWGFLQIQGDTDMLARNLLTPLIGTMRYGDNILMLVKQWSQIHNRTSTTGNCSPRNKFILNTFNSNCYRWAVPSAVGFCCVGFVLPSTRKFGV